MAHPIRVSFVTAEELSWRGDAPEGDFLAQTRGEELFVRTGAEGVVLSRDVAGELGCRLLAWAGRGSLKLEGDV